MSAKFAARHEDLDARYTLKVFVWKCCQKVQKGEHEVQASAGTRTCSLGAMPRALSVLLVGLCACALANHTSDEATGTVKLEKSPKHEREMHPKPEHDKEHEKEHDKEVHKAPHPSPAHHTEHAKVPHSKAPTTELQADLLPVSLLINVSSVLINSSIDSHSAIPVAVQMTSSGAFLSALTVSFFVIVATEIGDKTFFIAAVLTVRHSPSVIWIGAVGALALMTVLSAYAGQIAPMLLPSAMTHYIAVVLFAFFGYRMLKDGQSASSKVSEELEEVEQEVLGVGTRMGIPTQEAEQGIDGEAAEDGEGAAGTSVAAPAAGCMTIVFQAFTLTFVAEWGDRSQMATIAMGADQSVEGIIVGGILGHSLCTGIAVVGGKLLASRISERSVLLGGGSLFVGFAFIELVRGPGD